MEKFVRPSQLLEKMTLAAASQLAVVLPNDDARRLLEYIAKLEGLHADSDANSGDSGRV